MARWATLSKIYMKLEKSSVSWYYQHILQTAQYDTLYSEAGL